MRKRNKTITAKQKRENQDFVVCKAVYSLEPPKYSAEFKIECIQLYLEGNSAVGRLRKIGKNTLLGWLREYEKGLIADENKGKVKTVEQDELYTYIKKRQ